MLKLLALNTLPHFSNNSNNFSHISNHRPCNISYHFPHNNHHPLSSNPLFTSTNPPITRLIHLDINMDDHFVVDFSKFDDPKQAVRAWLEPTLPLRAAINLPQNPQADQVVEKEEEAEAEEEDTNSTIAPPFPWAANEDPTKVHSLDYLLANGITTVRGQLKCQRCNNLRLDCYNLRSKYREVELFARRNIHIMHQRAPKEWMVPAKKFADCDHCGQTNGMKPVVAAKGENINWLFLFLGQSLGACNIGQLKWFCQKSNRHRTGAKDRVLYSTYVGIGMQLDPQGVFEGWSDVRERR